MNKFVQLLDYCGNYVGFLVIGDQLWKDGEHLISAIRKLPVTHCCCPSCVNDYMAENTESYI